jgi:LPXTG-motif cell wall-anchored protein
MVGGQVKNFEAPTMGSGVSSAPGVELANTGAENTWLLALSAMLIAAGSILVTRKRRTE